jgi:hypothetical protein
MFAVRLKPFVRTPQGLDQVEGAVSTSGLEWRYGDQISAAHRH